MNEALMSALPVFMTDISPNNFILPPEWLIESEKIDRLLTRMTLDVYGADPKKLAICIDNYVNNINKDKEKKKAYDIGMQNFYVDTLKNKYLSVINDVVS
jgi:hypothetical protein